MFDRVRQWAAGWLLKGQFFRSGQAGWAAWMGNATSQSMRTDGQILKAYGTHPTLHGVTKKISESFASLEWTLSAVTNNRGKPIKSRARMVRDPVQRELQLQVHKAQRNFVEIETHPILDALDFGNPMLDGFAVMQLVQLYLDLTGDAVIVKGFDDKGMVTELWPVPVTWVQRRATPDDPWHKISINGSVMKFPAEDVIWIKEPNPVDPYGTGSSSAAALSTELDTDEYAAAFIQSFYKNHGVPSVIVSNEGAGAPGVKDQKQKWMDEFRGPQKAWGVHFSNKKVAVHHLSAEFKGKQSVELRRYLRDEFRHMYGVPPEIMGIVQNSNRATIDGAQTIMAVWVIVPRAERVRIAFQRQLVDPIDPRLILGYVSPVPIDKKHQLAVMNSAPTFFTADEWRRAAGNNPLGGDEGELVLIPNTSRPTTLTGLVDEANAPQPSDADDAAKGLNGSGVPMLPESTGVDAH